MARLLKNSEGKVLLPKDVWAYFSPSSTSYITDIGSTSDFNFIHQTGIFQIEFQYYPDTASDYTTNKYLFGNMVVNAGQNGIVLRASGLRTVLLNIGNGSGTLLLNSGTVTLPASSTNIYNIKIVGDGVGVYFYANGTMVNYTAYVGSFSVSNATYTMKIGAYASGSPPTDTTRCWQGGIRNFKFYTNYKILRNFYPMQDASFGTDIISGLNGTANGLTIVNKTDAKKWLYFNGTNSYFGFGTTSTLPWMNDGIFSIDITYRLKASDNLKHLASTAVNATQRGFSFYKRTSTLDFRWCNGTTATTISLLATVTIGMEYRTVIRADGVNIYQTTYDKNGTIISTNEPTGTAITFVSYAYSTYTPSLGTLNQNVANTYNCNCDISQFKIYSDSNLSVPFLDFDFNRANFPIDSVGQLQGRTYNVVLTNETYKVNLNRKLMADFSTSPYSNFITNSNFTTSSWNWIHETGIFTVEFDLFFKFDATNFQQIFYNAVLLAHRGIFICINNNTRYITVSIYNGSGTTRTVLAYSDTVNTMTDSTWYKVRIVGNGTSCQIGITDANKVTTYGNIYNYTLPLGTGVSYGSGLIGRGSGGAYITRSYLSNIKFYNGNELIYHFPLDNDVSLPREILTNTTGAITGIVKTVEI